MCAHRDLEELVPTQRVRAERGRRLVEQDDRVRLDRQLEPPLRP